MRDWKLWLIAPVLCVWPLAASADDSEAARLIAECGAEDLPHGSLDSCLERVRILDETEPSAQLQSLEGRLEKREVGENMDARAESTSVPQAGISRRVQVVAPPARADEGDSPETHDQDSSQSLSGSAADDQPPIADPPDQPSGPRSDDNQLDSPE